MTSSTAPIQYTIDAAGKRIGRVATEAAMILLGKTTPDFTKNQVARVKVTIINCAKADISTRKKDSKNYVTFTGFRGGLYDEKLGALIERKGYGEVFVRAVDGMLRRTKLKPLMLKNLTVVE
jgi:large subunit ribosomal protein L13